MVASAATSAPRTKMTETIARAFCVTMASMTIISTVKHPLSIHRLSVARAGFGLREVNGYIVAREFLQQLRQRGSRERGHRRLVTNRRIKPVLQVRVLRTELIDPPIQSVASSPEYGDTKTRPVLELVLGIRCSVMQ